MKIVIDMSEELYKNVVDRTQSGYVGSDVWIAVANGIPLPKGHGRLIEADALIQHTYSAVVDGVETDIIEVSDVDNAPTVIAAEL